MARFFIDRPIFAWVIAILVMVAGAVSITRLPIARYPEIAPPTVTINAFYSGASAETAQNSVTQIIEQNMKGLDGLIYMSSTSSSNGAVTVNLTFENGVDPDIAQVQVQNKLQLATPLLPLVVQQQGVSVTKANAGFLEVVGFVSEDGSMDPIDISDYVSSHLVDSLSRVPGVGSVMVFGGKYAMRIWLDPNKLETYGLTPSDVIGAVLAQNAQIAVGQLGATPAVPGQQLNATVTAQGRMQTPEQFRNVVLRSNTDGSVLRLADVARVELGSASYDFASRFNGKPSAGLAVTLSTNANALDTARGVEAELKQLSTNFPRGLRYIVPFDTTPFVRASVDEVVKTLLEAVGLVFLVMFLFLQSLRATLIPTIAVPVVLLGTFAVLAVLGLSINMLTMFAVVLAIGLLVDDAIVVVENVERLMSEEGLSPRDATRKSMDQITGALVAIAIVLSSVFVPMAFLQGATGVIYRQFSVTIVAAMLLSVLVAVILTPALCATLLRPSDQGEYGEKTGFFGWFNRSYSRGVHGYGNAVGGILKRTVRFVGIYAVLLVATVMLFFKVPTSFLPDEDQGILFVLVQGPVGATQERMAGVLKQVEDYFLHQEKAVESLFTVQGFSFAGSGQNTGMAFVRLKDWDQRTSPALGADAVAGRASGALSRIKDALVFAFAPPPVTSLGNSTGFDGYLEDVAGHGHAALMQTRNQLLGMAAQDKLLRGVRPNGQEDAPELHVDLDTRKAKALGLSMADVGSTLSVAWGGRYIDDFLDRGLVKRVYVQADAPFRMRPEDFDRWYVRSAAGEMVPVSAFATTRWEYGPPMLQRYKGIPAVEIVGQAAPGVSSGASMQEMEKLVARLSPGYALEWTGQSYQERAAGAQTPLLYSLSVLVIFLSLAALYESWSIPTSVLLVAPLGILGAVLATFGRGLARDVYFQVAMLTTVGLASKNAILIVEFAKDYIDQGKELVAATLQAVRDRLRPILMTSLAFGLGVLPLAFAHGAGSGAQRAIGTGVLGGMMAGTFLGIFFIPLFFVVVRRLASGGSSKPADDAEEEAAELFGEES